MVDKIQTKIIAGCSPNESSVHLSNQSVSRRSNSGQLHKVLLRNSIPSTLLGEPEMRHKDFLESIWQWRKGRTHFFTLNPTKISCSRPYPQMTAPSKSFYGDLSFYNHRYPMARNIRQPQSSTKDEHHWKNDWLQARRKEITQDGILF